MANAMVMQSVKASLKPFVAITIIIKQKCNNAITHKDNNAKLVKRMIFKLKKNNDGRNKATPIVLDTFNPMKL